MVTFHSDQGREAPWLSQSETEIEKPLNQPRFQGREAPWSPQFKIEIEKSLNPPQIQIEIEMPLNHLRFQGSIQVYLEDS